METDLTFITNEEGHKLVDRFEVLMKGTKFFDCLVGYFYSSGFNTMYKSFENVEKIRILIGIGTDKTTFKSVEKSKYQLNFSNVETKNYFSEKVIEEMNNSDDSKETEEGILKFIEWLKSGKLEIRAFPGQNIHAKLYIMTSSGEGWDKGRVITGSSNFTKSGLIDNLEFNVELKDSRDYEYALKKFNELWEASVDVSEKYVETVNTKTWLNEEITPYEMFLKFLYEYLKEKINLDKVEIMNEYMHENFMDLNYQKDAVRDAKMILDSHGGVFISDVVGLGKTYITAMLAKELDGGTLVIAPPILLDKNNPGSWRNVFFEFGVSRVEFESLGKLDKILERDIRKYKNIIIDEAHKFRNESTQTYEQLYKICRGKRVILVSATPLNNTPMDILALIKLFQKSRKSTLQNPKVRDLDNYFKSLDAKLKKINRKENREEYLKIVKENAEDIRKNVLQYLMIRRTRTVIEKYYKKDLEKQKLLFPKVNDPKPIIYHFSKDIDSVFNKTLELVIKDFKYSRYTPLLYLNKELPENEKIGQRNMGKWMKILLLKRLESSFYAFKKSISRFIDSYKIFIKEFEKGNVYISDKYSSKVFELLEDEDVDALDLLLSKGKVTKYSSEEFSLEFIDDLKSDLKILNKINDMWINVKTDPKIDTFINVLKKDKILSNKVIVFTESKETAEYIQDNLNPIFDNKVLAYSGSSDIKIREKVIENFDPSSNNKNNDVRILVSTEVLSEGLNLNKSNVVVNYDIPWNPIKMMQRVGRINRIGKNLPFNEIYTYNFFPAGPINEEIELTEAAEMKINSFIEMLGNDSKLLTDEEIKSHELYRRLNSKEIITGEEQTEDVELEWLLKLRDIRDNNSKLFDKIKNLPKKSRTARKNINKYGLFTFFRKGSIRKLYYNDGNTINEIDFSQAIDLLNANKTDKKYPVTSDYYTLLEENKKDFYNFFEEELSFSSSGNRGNEGKLQNLIKALRITSNLKENDKIYLNKILSLIHEGSIPKNTIKKILVEKDKEEITQKIISKIKLIIPEDSLLFNETNVSKLDETNDIKEIILSEMFINE